MEPVHVEIALRVMLYIIVSASVLWWLKSDDWDDGV
jgi:hypothetical protein